MLHFLINSLNAIWGEELGPFSDIARQCRQNIEPFIGGEGAFTVASDHGDFLVPFVIAHRQWMVAATDIKASS